MKEMGSVSEMSTPLSGVLKNNILSATLKIDRNDYRHVMEFSF